MIRFVALTASRLRKIAREVHLGAPPGLCPPDAPTEKSAV
jgi:hypothetical protein